MKKIVSYAAAHKIISTILVTILLGGGYWGYKKYSDPGNQIQYILAKTERGTIVVSVTGSGQVSSSNQIDIKPKTSGEITRIGVQSGQQVAEGNMVAQINATTAEKAVRDAEANLKSAKIALEKLKAPADSLSMIQTKNALDQASDNLIKAYDDGFTGISNAFLDLPGIMSGLQNILYSSSIGAIGQQDNISAYADMIKNYDIAVLVFKDDAAQKYLAARKSYDKNFNDYKAITRFSDKKIIEDLISETYDTAKIVAEAVKSSNDLLNFVKDRLTERNLSVPAQLPAHLSSLSTYTSQVNSRLLDLFNVKTAITNNRRTIAEKTEALASLTRGANPLDIQTQELTVTQRENALRDAQTSLADYTMHAPFAGTVAKLNAKRFDSVSPSTIIATLITTQKIAEISLNEVDAAKIKVTQKTTLTFDAVEGLTISGQVTEVDTIGTVTQGVVTYMVKIGFDTQDDRIKPGMSVSAAIITDVKPDVLLVPNSAIKTQQDNQYVEMFGAPTPSNTTVQNNNSAGIVSETPPQSRQVETGLSNDTSTEIIRGINEGDEIVVRTISAQAQTTASAPSLFGTPRGVGGNANRGIQGR